MKCCPRCRQPIFNCRRYKATILAKFHDIQTVLARTAQSGEDIQLETVAAKLCEPEEDPNATPTFKADLRKLEAFDGSLLERTVKRFLESSRKKRPHAMPAMEHKQRHLLHFQAELSLSAAELLGGVKEPSLRVRVQRVAWRVLDLKLYTTDQFMTEASGELARLSALGNLRAVAASAPCRHGDAYVTARLRQMEETLRDVTRPFTTQDGEALRRLVRECKAHSPGLAVTEQERLSILKAMGSVSGHWYKCPRGHFYYIGECGGAVTSSQCPECGSVIGGGQHRLAAGNRHAPEMDGSARAAWPPH